MHKKGGGLRRSNWKRRYFVLSGTLLQYFSDASQKNNFKGAIDLTTVYGIKRVPDYPGGPEHYRTFTFEVRFRALRVCVGPGSRELIGIRRRPPDGSSADTAGDAEPDV